MIIKNKDPITSVGIRQIAGDKQEQDVAFYLRREFKDTVNVFIFNDLRIKHNDEVAQIDHLILYEYGFVLIESKSITGEVAVNSDEEWSRSYNGKWSGMPSPIQQVGLQEKLLRDLLHENREKLLGKILFGTLQTAFGGRCWNQFCAISSNSIIQRDNMPEGVSSKLVKSEFLIKKVKDIIPNTINRGIFKLDNGPWFSPEEMKKICNFLLTEHQPVHSIKDNDKIAIAAPTTSTMNEPVTISIAEKVVLESATAKLSCKSCGNSEGLQGAWGKFGYYVKCGSCGTNTTMKKNCCNCSSNNTKVSKKKSIYSLTCQDCGETSEVFIQGKSNSKM